MKGIALMIKFISHIVDNMDKINNMDYCELLNKECYFCIVVDNKVFYEEPLFPIYEFLYCYSKWDKTKDFKYVTIESDDNPMITFKKVKNGWLISSPWERFKCNKIFTLSELINGIESLIA